VPVSVTCGFFLGQIGQVSSVINAAVLKFPQEHACFVLGLEKCMPSMLTLIQLVAIWAFTFPVYLWYLKFLDPRTLPKQDQRLAKVFFGVLLAFIATVSVISAVLIIFAGECAKATKSWGYAMGLVATAITFVQWSPQIYATFRRKSVGSFSILMLCIQCPGAILILYFFIFVSHEGVSTWLSYLSSVTQQLVLLAMLVYYDRKNKRGDMSVNQEERQTLLPPLEESTLKESSLKD